MAGIKIIKRGHRQISLRAESRNAKRLLNLIFEITRAVNSGTNPEGVFDSVAKAVYRVVPFDKLSIALINDNFEHLRVFPLSPKSARQERREDALPVRGSRAGYALRERRLVHTPNLDRNIRFQEDNYLVQSKILSVLTIPLIHQGKAIGTLNLGRRPRKGFAKAEINLLNQIIPQICLSIVCARPYGQVRSAQSALEQNYRILFDHASDAIFIIDPDTRRIVEGNQRAEFMTGFSSEELRKMAIEDLIEPEERSHVQDFFKTLIKEKKVLVGSFPSRRKDGSRGEVEISACLIEHGDRRVVQSIFRDVTERQAAETERTQLLGKIQASYEELRLREAQLVHSEKMASLEQLVAGVAHELNNPIGILNSHLEHFLGFLGDLRQMFRYYDDLLEHDPEKQRQAEKKKGDVELSFILDTMEKLVHGCRCGAQRTKEIVENLRTFSRMDEAAVKEADIHENLEITLTLLGNQIQDRIVVHREYGNIPRLECNIGQLNQVFMNLILNACQAIPLRGDIWIRTRVKEEVLTVSIRDNGVGIPQCQLSRIFDPFFTTKEPGRGSGLGLAIAFGVVKEHKGSIDVQSQAGRGSTFTVKLPIKRQLVWETDF